jgi:hypothetical protein
MRTVTRTMIILGLLIGGAFSAMADIMWTLSDVAFDNGNVASGWFLVNPTLNAYDAYSLTVTGPDSAPLSRLRSWWTRIYPTQSASPAPASLSLRSYICLRR